MELHNNVAVVVLASEVNEDRGLVSVRFFLRNGLARHCASENALDLFVCCLGVNNVVKTVVGGLAAKRAEEVQTVCESRLYVGDALDLNAGGGGELCDIVNKSRFFNINSLVGTVRGNYLGLKALVLSYFYVPFKRVDGVVSGTDK